MSHQFPINNYRVLHLLTSARSHAVTVVFDSLNATRDKEAVISHVLGGAAPYSFDIRITQILCSSVRPIPEESE